MVYCMAYLICLITSCQMNCLRRISSARSRWLQRLLLPVEIPVRLANSKDIKGCLYNSLRLVGFTSSILKHMNQPNVALKYTELNTKRLPPSHPQHSRQLDSTKLILHHIDDQGIELIFSCQRGISIHMTEDDVWGYATRRLLHPADRAWLSELPARAKLRVRELFLQFASNLERTTEARRIQELFFLWYNIDWQHIL